MWQEQYAGLGGARCLFGDMISVTIRLVARVGLCYTLVSLRCGNRPDVDGMEHSSSTPRF